MGATVVRDADGINVPVLLNVSTPLVNHGWWLSSIFSQFFGNGYQNYHQPECVANYTCKYGLTNNFQVTFLLNIFVLFIALKLLMDTVVSS